MLILTAAAAIWFIRPSNMDPGSNLMTFMDPGLFELGVTYVGVNATTMSAYDSPETISSEDEHEVPEQTETITEQRIFPSFMVPPSSLKPLQTTLVVSKKDLKLLTRTSTVDIDDEELLRSYEPLWHPLLGLARNGSHPSQIIMGVPKPAVDIHLMIDTASSEGVGPQSKFLLDGMERSPYLNVVGMTFLNSRVHRVKIGERGWGNRPMVWVVDWGSMQRDCHRLQRALESHERRTQDYVLLVDYSGSTRQSQCDSYFQNDTRVRLAKRAVVSNRHYDHNSRMIYNGEISSNSLFLESDAGSHTRKPVMQASLVVRERFVTALLNDTRGNNPMKSKRRTDVCFFWKRGDYSHYGFWRRDVSEFVENFGSTTEYTTLVDVVANDEEGVELGNIQLNYVRQLLLCKIVVVAQRDEWEDHYRLYESLASGALVLTDPMLAPPEGLRNKTNVVVYDSLESLERLIRFYLENDSKRKSVARRGMELALGRYRSWHRMEQLLFGRAMFQVDEPLVRAPPKMTRPQITQVDGKTSIPT